MNDQALNRMLDMGWTQLELGVTERGHPARYPTLATTGQDGPELRTLILRRVDRDAHTLELHTDALSPKVAQLQADPRVALHVWLPEPKLQLRLRGMAETRPGDREAFQTLPPEAQANYGGTAPGARLQDESNLPQGDAARFTRILCRINDVDILSLNDQPHRRAIFHAARDWQGIWVAP